MAALTSLVVNLIGDISQYEKEMNKAQALTQQIGASMMTAGKALTAGVTLPLVGAGAAAVHFANDFNSGMANVASLGQEAADAVEGWAPMVQDMAIVTGKSTSDMTAGLYTVVSAFGVANDTLEVLEINARAAAGGLATTEEAISLTSAVTKAWGDTSADAVQSAADLALKAVQLGQTTFPELAASVGRVAPLMAQLGGSQEELFAVMATGTGVTGNAAEVSTQLRGVLQSLMAPTESMTELFSSLGYESGAAFLQAEGLQGVITAIIAAAEASGQPLQSFIGSIEGQTLAMALAGGQAEAFTQKTLAMGEASGAVNEAFAAQTEGVNAVGFGFQQARVQMEVWAQQIGAQLLPVIAQLMEQAQPIIDWISGVIQKFAELNPQTQGIILVLAGLVAAAGPVLIILGALVTAIGALLSPIGLVIAIMAALAVAWANDWGGIQAKTAEALAFIQNLINTVFAAIQAFWAAHGEQIMATATTVWTTIQLIVETVLAAIQDLITTVMTAIQEFWTAHGETILAFTEQIWDLINMAIDTVLVNIQALFAAFAAAFEGDWTAFGENLRVIWDNTWQFIRDLLAGIWNVLQPIFANLIASIINVFRNTNWWEVGMAIINGIANGIRAGVGAISDAARSAAQAALDAAKGFLGIHSPSRVAASLIGAPFAQGIGVGITKEMPSLSSALMTALDGGLLQPALAGADSFTGNVTNNFYGPADPAQVGQVTQDAQSMAFRRRGMR